MPPHAPLSVVALAAVTGLAVAASGCGQDDACSGHSHDPACLVCLGDEDPLTPGEMLDLGNGFTVEVVSATPTPFVAANNEMVVKVRKDGNLTDGVDFTGTQTWYPPGGHGSPLPILVAATTNPGEYGLTQINFVHEGPWELRYAVAAAGATGALDDRVCIEAAP